jgi:CRP/FNR family transcriptional regulator
MDNAELRSRAVERFPVLAELPAEMRERVMHQSHVRTAPEGTVLFEANTPCSAFPLLLDGSVRVVRIAPNGREILLYRVEAGESCILSGGCLLGQTDHKASGIAESPVRMLAIPPALFNELMVHHPPFRQYVFGEYGARLAEVMELVEEVAFRRLDQRLAQLLIHRGPVWVGSQQKLADELGSVREFISRLLHSFANRGWVKLERERIVVLDTKSLAALAGS